MTGGPERTRTSDLRFRKPLLYPAELRDHAIDALAFSTHVRQLGYPSAAESATEATHLVLAPRVIAFCDVASSRVAADRPRHRPPDFLRI